ncbi:MAG: glycosyltransferase family 1 protein [Candidatus Berkelbacteria bacterium]|nr:glycosyltransferase family 1 protein [Candidatus Berkelbacteria bacterium]
MSKILVDGRFIGVGDSIGRYTFGILEHLLDIDSENHYSLLIRPAGIKQVKEHGFWDSDRVKVEVQDIAHYSMAEQTKLLVWLNKKPYDLVYFTQFNHPIYYRKPYIITIHDMTTFGYFGYQNPLRVIPFKMAMKSAVRDSKKIISVSKKTGDELVDYYKVDKRKIEVIYCGIDQNYVRISKMDQADRVKLGNKFKKHYELESEYLLYTGMWKKHKNLMRLLQAFKKVRSDVGSIQLVLAGKVDKDEPEIVTEIENINGHEIDKTMSSDPVFVAGFVPEELLSAAYAGAIAYTQSSLNEGFGLPPLEAMACGAPVVASNISATPEVLGDAASYFDPENVDDMMMKIEEVVMNQRLRLDLRKRGLERVKLYSWNENAKKTLKIIEEVLKSN